MTISSKLQERRAGQGKQIAGRLCLDFVNLVGGWESASARSASANSVVRDDRLNDYVDLVAWALRANVLNDTQAKRLTTQATAHPDEAGRIFKRAQRLRAAIHAVAKRIEDERPPDQDALDVLADEISRGWSKQHLTFGSPNLAWTPEDRAASLDSPLAAVALSAEELFTTADLSRLHSCPGDQCGWLFEDTTKNRSRRWCDMGDCGNKAKVREFRSRQARA